MVPPRNTMIRRVIWCYPLVLTGFIIFSWNLYFGDIDASITEESLSLQGRIPIAELVSQSDLIVRGRIVEIESGWNSDQTAIITVSTFEPQYAIAGDPDDLLTIHTDGGFVEGDIGMKSSNDPLFVEGEEAVLFLHNSDGQLKVTQGELGRYAVSGLYLVNGVLRTTVKMESVYDDIHVALLEEERTVQTPDDWQSYETNAPPIVYDGYDGQGFVYKNRKWGGTCPEVKYKININTDQAGGDNGSVEEFRNAIVSAANSWNAVGTSDFRLIFDGETDATTTGFNGSNEIIFSSEGTSSPTGLARFWFTADFIIVEADIWFNDDFNWDVTGSPKFTEVDLESVALHEFGHWLALGHDDSASAIMYPTLTMGMLKRELHQNEKDGISFIYPRPDDSACAQAIIPTNTPANTATPEPVPPTATPEPVVLEPTLHTNFEDGSPGSFFTISGSNYVSNETVSLNINGDTTEQLQASSEGAFAIILDTADAQPGTYTISVPSTQSASGQGMAKAFGQVETVSILLDMTKEQRPKDVPERSNDIQVVEVALTDEADTGINLYLPLTHN